jgi:hypothetical protein
MTYTKKHFKLTRTNRFWLFLAIVFNVAGVAFAQTYNGSLRGSITDPSSATVAGASITLTDESTQQVRSTTSNEAGAYAFNALRPSTYTLHVTSQNFSPANRTHIALATQDFLTLDVQLRIGTTNNEVQVSAEAPLVDSSTASVDADLDQRRLEDLPVQGRNPYITAGLSGVFVNTGNPQFIRFADQNGTTATSVAGGPIASNLYLIDGVPITDTNNRPIAIPTIESIQDVKVQALTYDAQVGRTGGGVFNTLLRSGSNTVHGSFFGETRQTDWLANDFFAKRSGIARPESPYYNWGASLGGPVVIPHLYNGRDKTFFWAGTEGYIQTSPYTETFVVPTDYERAGNFSQTYNADKSLHVIYNPYDTYTDANGVHRRPYANNIISNQNSVGAKIASYFPSPTPGTNTFTGTDNVRDHALEATVKLDQQIRPWWNVSGSYIFYQALQPLGNPLGTLPGSYSYTYHRQVDATQINSTWILNPSTVLTARYGINRFPNLIAEVSQGFDPATLGFPASYTSNLQSKFFPTIFFDNYAQLGQNTSQLDDWKSQLINGALTKSAGHHNFTFGAEYRRLRLNFQDYSNAPGTYTFSGAFTQANPSSSDGLSGSDIADLLLGVPISGEVDLTTRLNTYLDYNALFAQDDWRITRRLTLNLGVRWESETGLKEDHDQLAVGFNRTASSKLSNGTAVTGGILFAGLNGNQHDIGSLSRLKFAPRIGAAYRLTDNTVIRGGYGILYAPIRYDPIAALAPGYTQDSSYVASSDNNQTPANTLSNPFPSGFTAPAGNSAGLLTGAGNSVTTYDQSYHSPRVQQFSVDIERDLPGHIALDVAYIGTRSINLSPSPASSSAININQLNPSNFTLGSTLSDPIANPDYVSGGSGILGKSTVSRSQTLRPFPQFTSVNVYVSSAHADYNALLVKAEKRAGHGLNLLASFTWSRNWDSSFAATNSIQSPGVTAPQNVYNLEAEYSRSNTDTPFRFVTGALYDLPIGRGERYSTGNRWVDEIIGHWQLNVLPTFRSGFPVSIHQSSNPNSTVAGNGVQRPNLVAGAKLGTSGSLYDRLNGYINSAAFTASSAYTFGNAPRTLSLRGPGYANWDLALFKNFPVYSRANVQVRAQAFNALNTPLFNGPNTSFGSSNFGKITSQANFPRYIQLGLHITY